MRHHAIRLTWQRWLTVMLASVAPSNSLLSRLYWTVPSNRSARLDTRLDVSRSEPPYGSHRLQADGGGHVLMEGTDREIDKYESGGSEDDLRETRLFHDGQRETRGLNL